MDDARTEIRGGGVFVRDGRVEQVGTSESLPGGADNVIDATGLALMPGLVNTHHHFVQALTRAVPGAQDQKLFDWLTRLYPIWAGLTDEAVYTSSLIAMAELMLSGCTTSSDHLYLYPNDTTLDAQVRAANDIGLRFHVARGSMSVGRSGGGLPPDDIVQPEDVILRDCRRAVAAYHDPRPHSMLRVVLAPCSPFSVSSELMIATADLAREHDGVMLHTHVAETLDEEVFCEERFGLRPAALMEKLGWTGPDVWWAHAIFLNDEEIAMLARTQTGIAHCPSSNMRLGSGIARVRELLDAGVNVGLGVDGSASNDGGHLISEARTAVLLQRVAPGAHRFPVRDGLALATRGGASVLGRSDIGSLQTGMSADFIGIDLRTLAMAGGAIHDPVAALLLCSVDRVTLSVINGRVVVAGGKLLTIDLERAIADHNRIARALGERSR